MGYSMSFQTYWGRKLLKNEKLITHERITISIESFKLELEKAYRAGQLDPVGTKPASSFSDLFRDFRSY